jgi:hypothetical protein
MSGNGVKQTAGGESAVPPDLILIPDRLKSVPIDPLGAMIRGACRNKLVAVRLGRMLREAGVACLGDLDGKRLSDFEERRGCGPLSRVALRRLVIKALYPGVRETANLRPIRMRDYVAPPAAIQVAEADRGLKVDELPMSVRLEKVLGGMGMRRLGELHGVLLADLLARPNCWRGTVAELQRLVGRAAAGEFSFCEEERARWSAKDLLEEMDRLVGALSLRDRGFLLLRFGGVKGEMASYKVVGKRFGVTSAGVWARLASIFRLMRRRGGPKLRGLLGMAVSPGMIRTLVKRRGAGRYLPAFYLRVMALLRDA